MPDWVPARIKGKPVDKESYLPINFTITSDW
jgi:hypothetical protein